MRFRFRTFRPEIMSDIFLRDFDLRAQARARNYFKISIFEPKPEPEIRIRFRSSTLGSGPNLDFDARGGSKIGFRASSWRAGKYFTSDFDLRPRWPPANIDNISRFEGTPWIIYIEISLCPVE